jgi:methionyl-tRNA formyltransferase
MRIMIVGQKWFAAEVLRLCVDLGHQMVKVAAPTADDRLVLTALEAGIHAAVIERRVDAHNVLDGTDLIVAAHAHCYVTAEARQKARHGAIGYHPSLLPLHRGRDAIEWAIRLHEPVTGGSVYWMDDRADGGPVIAQDWCFVRPGDTASDLWRRELAPMGLRLFREALGKIAAGDVTGGVQDETLATWEPSLSRRRLGG